MVAGISALRAATPVFTFESGKKYYIACEFTSGFLAIGSNHATSYELYYVQESTVSNDG